MIAFALAVLLGVAFFVIFLWFFSGLIQECCRRAWHNIPGFFFWCIIFALAIALSGWRAYAVFQEEFVRPRLPVHSP